MAKKLNLVSTESLQLTPEQVAAVNDMTQYSEVGIRAEKEVSPGQYHSVTMRLKKNEISDIPDMLLALKQAGIEACLYYGDALCGINLFEFIGLYYKA